MSMTRGQHLIGREIGPCVLEKPLGYGGSSAVFLAQPHGPHGPRGDEQKVAIKVFLPRSTMNVQMQKDFYTRFLSEAEAASQLNHPNILPIYSYGEQDGLPYIIMPYMPGGTLSEYIAAHGCLSLTEAQLYLEQIAAALDYAHAQGCVHCDIKPANILLDGDGNVMLSDFGIAHMMLRETENSPQQAIVKAPGMLMGTPDYISPEQALGQPLDGRSDVYSLGVTLFFLLAGRLPFKADSTIAVALLHVHEPPPALSLLRGDISPVADHVIQKALAKRPEARYRSAGELSADFTEAIANDGMVHVIDQRQVSPVHHNGHMPFRGSRSSSGKRVLLDRQPTVLIKPTTVKRKNFSRTFIVITVLVTVMLWAGILGGVLTTHFTGGTSHAQATVPTNAVVDDLSNSDDWPTGGAFFFTGDQYHMQNRSAHNVALSLYANHTYVNFHLSVTMAELHGTADGADYYGIAFRGTPDQSHYYLFEVSAWGGGQYQCLRYDGNGQWKTLGGGPTPAPLYTQGKSNTITVVAKGNTFSFWINNIPISQSITDTHSGTSQPVGEVGFSVEEQGTEVAFSGLFIKSLP